MTGARQSYVDQLDRELARAGMPAGRRRRICREIADHFSCDPSADLGDPAILARQFADELGTSRAREAALAAFGALAAAGTLFGAAFLAAGAASGFAVANTTARSTVLGYLAIALVVLAPQFGLAAGALAAIRALRRRRELVLPHDECLVLARRAQVGLAAGLASMAGLALMAAEYGHGVASWWTVLALAAAGVGAAALLAAAPALRRAQSLVPAASGPAGDIFDDLGSFAPEPLRGRPWAFALAFAVAITIAITIAGVGQADGIDGALRGLLDGVVCLIGFATLGGYLGLRGSHES